MHFMKIQSFLCIYDIVSKILFNDESIKLGILLGGTLYTSFVTGSQIESYYRNRGKKVRNEHSFLK